MSKLATTLKRQPACGSAASLEPHRFEAIALQLSPNLHFRTLSVAGVAPTAMSTKKARDRE